MQLSALADARVLSCTLRADTRREVVSPVGARAARTTPHGLLTRAAMTWATRPAADERDGSAWAPRRSLPTRASGPRDLLTRHVVLCCHKVMAISQLWHAAGADFEPFAVCYQFMVRAAAHRFSRRTSNPRSSGPVASFADRRRRPMQLLALQAWTLHVTYV